MSEEKTLFDRIISKEIPANIVYEDELVINNYNVSVWLSKILIHKLQCIWF